jgi:hypothetical protein
VRDTDGERLRSGCHGYTETVLVAARLAAEYGFTDIDGKTPARPRGPMSER